MTPAEIVLVEKARKQLQQLHDCVTDLHRKFEALKVSVGLLQFAPEMLQTQNGIERKHE